VDHYRFPHITRIEQCLEAIKGADNFVVAERDGHIIINYIMMDSHTFPAVHPTEEWNKLARPVADGWYRIKDQYFREGDYDINAAIRRECRGIIFDADGNIISRRLHKFFNVNERPETELKGIDFKVPHRVLEKLDGSMITPIPIRNHIRWGTKMGLTEVGFQAEEFVSTRKAYLDFAEYCVEHHLTPIFEWCSRKQRIVLDYPKDDLVLLAIRNTFTGEYLPYENMWGFAKFWKVPCVSTLGDGSIVNPEEFVDGVINNQHDGLMEGFVVRFDDGHSIKIKTSDYVRIHRAKDSILQEKRVVEMIANDKCDDVLPHLINHDKYALELFRDAFWNGIQVTADEIYWLFSHWWNKTNGNKRTFAIKAEMNPTYKSVCFSVWNEWTTSSAPIREELIKRVLKNIGSGTMVESNRWIWQNHKWADFIKAQDENVEN
jgi:T4 RnlA family RNA ligase